MATETMHRYETAEFLPMRHTTTTRLRRLLPSCLAITITLAGSGCVPELFNLPGYTPGQGSDGPANVRIGADNNNNANPFVQPQDPALAGGDRDQSLQNGDVLFGTATADVLIGRLGSDTLLGYDGDDVLIGGTEHFSSNNRDRAFGEYGNDVFIWTPGDGSDFFDGGPGLDVIIFGLIAERENGQTVFRVANDQQAGDIVLDPNTNLPTVDVTNSPGFCTVLDAATSAEAAAELEALDLDHLVRFSIRGIADAFEAGTQTDDNGLRVTLHLRRVEFVVCTARNGGEIEVLDLRTSPPTVISLAELASEVPAAADLAF